MTKRRGVTVSPEALAEALHALPASCFKDGHFVSYSKLSMKLTPKWEEVKTYIHVLHKLVDLTGGHNLLQTNMLQGMTKYIADAKIRVTPEASEAAAYSLRCMLSQLANFKTSKRPLPRTWKSLFETLLTKLVVIHGDDNDDESPKRIPLDDAVITKYSPPPASLVEV
jgi:hypothetical protein